MKSADIKDDLKEEISQETGIDEEIAEKAIELNEIDQRVTGKGVKREHSIITEVKCAIMGLSDELFKTHRPHEVEIMDMEQTDDGLVLHYENPYRNGKGVVITEEIDIPDRELRHEDKLYRVCKAAGVSPTRPTDLLGEKVPWDLHNYLHNSVSGPKIRATYEPKNKLFYPIWWAKCSLQRARLFTKIGLPSVPVLFLASLVFLWFVPINEQTAVVALLSFFSICWMVGYSVKHTKDRRSQIL